MFALIEGPIPNAPEAKYISQIPSPNNLLTVSTALKHVGLTKRIRFHNFLRERHPPIIKAENIVYNAGEATCIDPLYNYSNIYLQKLRDHNPDSNIWLTGHYSWLHRDKFRDMFLGREFINTDPFTFEGDISGYTEFKEWHNDWTTNDWDFMRRYVYSKVRGIRATIRSSRGCAYGRCRMCPVAIVYKPRGKVVRYSIDWVMQEITTLYHEYGVREIGFLDDHLFFNRKYGKELLHTIIDAKLKGLRFTFEEGLDVPTALDEELLALLKQAHFYHIKLGVESFQKETLEFINKPYKDPDMAIRAIKLLKKYRLSPVCFICIGFPTNTEASIRKDVEILVKLKVKLRVQILWGYPGIDFVGKSLSDKKLRELQKEAMDRTGSSSWKDKESKSKTDLS